MQTVKRSDSSSQSTLSFVRSKKASARGGVEAAPFRLVTRHVLTGEEMSVGELKALLDFAAVLKKERATGVTRPYLPGRQVALLFEKPSLRTRVSFTVAMNELGGDAIEILAANTKGEEPEDTARVLAGYCQAIMARTYSHRTLERMVEVSKSAVINGLSDFHHPCQALADLLTLKERFGSLEGLKLAYVGDGNNVLHSLLLLAPLLGVEVRFACPKGYAPDPHVLASAIERSTGTGGAVVPCENPADAVRGVQAIYTDVWTSMGFEDEKAKREEAFKGYQVNAELYALAEKNAAIMHCLPMVPGQEITREMAEHPNSAIFQQSENRLHVQKALLVGLLS